MKTQQATVFDAVTGFSEPQPDPTITETALKVTYKPPNPAHATVLSQDQNGKWEPFYIDTLPLAAASLVGVPELEVVTGLMKSVETGSFIGSISGSVIQTSFHDAAQKTVCIYVDQSTIVFKAGAFQV